MSDAGIGSLVFSCLSLDTCFPGNQWSGNRETEGRTDRQLPSGSSSNSCRELTVTALSGSTGKSRTSNRRTVGLSNLLWVSSVSNRVLCIYIYIHTHVYTHIIFLWSCLIRGHSLCALIMHIFFINIYERSQHWSHTCYTLHLKAILRQKCCILHKTASHYYRKNFSAIWVKALATGFTPKGSGCLVDSFVTGHQVP